MTPKRYLRSFLLSLLLTLSALSAALPVKELSPDKYREHVTFLASDNLKGRGNGTPELERAAEYIAAQFRASGLQPAGTNGTFFQRFDLTVGADFGPKNSLQISNVTKARDKDFVTMPLSSSGSYEGPIVFAGYGITSEALKWDDYAGIDVKGKAVLVFRHDPEEGKASSRFADPKDPSSSLASKVRNARSRGARAILIVTDPNNHSKEPDSLAASAELDFRDMSILAMHVTRESVEPLFQQAGRSMSVAQTAIDSEQKPQSFELSNSKIRVSTEIRTHRKTVRNVMAAVRGSDSKLRNEWIVVGAHYDHLGLGDPKHVMSPAEVGKIHHGADDNASGTAGLLELARLFGSNKDAFKRSILFMAFAGEELGLFGSSHFVNNPTVPLPSINAMLNMDMIGRLTDATEVGAEPKALSVVGVGTAPEFPAWVEQANKEAGLKLALSNGGHDGSDHISFSGKRIPTLFFFSGLHKDYHRPTDTAEKIDSKRAVQVLSLVAGTAELIANAPARPQYTEVKDERPQTGTGGSPYATYFGSVPDFRDDLNGLLFADVRADSPAAKAGLKPGDLMVEFAGEPIKNIYDFTDALGSKKPGDVVSVVVRRNGQAIKVNVTLEVRR